MRQPEPFLPGGIEPGQQCVMPPPHRSPSKFQMGNMHRQFGFAADATHLIHRLENISALAPHMADVNTSVFRDCSRQVNQLIGFGKSTGKINQTGGHSQRPIVHAFGDI